MNLPDLNIIHQIDALTKSQYSFAIYRLPWTDECTLILQIQNNVEVLDNITELNGKQGFVLAPFRISDKHPLVVLRPDVMACGWSEINTALNACSEHIESLKHNKSNKPYSPSITDSETEDYSRVFMRFIDPLKKQQFQKLVLSRSESHRIAEEFSPLTAFIKACNSYPRMMIYLCGTPQTGTWLGSTPEILLSGQKKDWHTVALAGTMPMIDDSMPENWSDKNKKEQALVADYIRDVVKKFGNNIEEKGPYTARAGQLVHLKTDFRFQIKNADIIGNMLEQLHPTPAVCGLPKIEAYQFIADNEGYERKYYSGFIGWLEPEGQTDLYVNLRCMEIHNKEVTLYAGGGILASSDVNLEYEETKEKMKTMKNIL